MVLEGVFQTEKTLQEEKIPVRVETQVAVTRGAAARVFFSAVFPTPSVAEGASPSGAAQKLFDNATDEVSRPLRGRFAHLPYSSEQFIEEKQAEVELEDRQP